MFNKVLSGPAKSALALLGKSNLLQDAYLAGGTALALQFGHRYSEDFDFFTRKNFEEQMIAQKMTQTFPDFRLEQVSWGTVLGYIKDVRFSFFFYKYPLLADLKKFSGINVADPKDITPMKITAIADRGRKRDFVDLYFILAAKKLFSLKKALKLYDKKFKVLRQNKVHILKSLSYFNDAEKDEMPEMIISTNWAKVKLFFENEVKKVSREFLD